MIFFLLLDSLQLQAIGFASLFFGYFFSEQKRGDRQVIAGAAWNRFSGILFFSFFSFPLLSFSSLLLSLSSS
jgi:hypothetical protein